MSEMQSRSEHYRQRRHSNLMDRAILVPAIWESFRKLDPRSMARNPVMFVVEVGSVITTIVFVAGLFNGAPAFSGANNELFVGQITIWLWFTVLFANFAEAVAEGRGKAQAAALRKTRTETIARRLVDGREERVPATTLVKGDRVVCEAGDIIPGDGDVVEGIASVDESAITGESAPVIREAGGDRTSVTGGTRVLSDRIVVEITANPGETFLDRMIGLVESASRRKTPNEIALNILLAALTIIFMFATVTLQPFAMYAGTSVTITVLIALLVCLIPTTIGACSLRSASRVSTASCSETWSRFPGAQSKRPGTWTRSFWTRRARSRTGTARRRSSSPRRACRPTGSSRRPSSRAWPMKHPKVSRSWLWRDASARPTSSVTRKA